jgi:hypothetical protein
MTDEPNKKPDGAYKLLNVQWPDGIGPSNFANNACVVSDGTVVHVLFAQVSPPFFVGSEKELKERIEKVTAVPAIPVIKLTIPLENFRGMVRSFSEHLEKMDKLLNP